MAVVAKSRTLGHEVRRKAALDASWERRRTAVSRRIEQEALALFLGRGIDAVTVDDIAAAAKISRRSFYRYFESPTDIVCRVLSRSMDWWAQAVRARPVDEPLLDSFRAADAYALGLPENAPMLRMALAAARRSSKDWRRIAGLIQAHKTPTYRALIAERLQAQGKDPGPAGAIAAGLTAMMIQLAEQSGCEDRMLEPEEFEQALAAFQGLFAPSPG